MADLRAATPSNAAELAVPDCAEMLETLRSLDIRRTQAVRKKLVFLSGRLAELKSRRVMQSPAGYIDARRVALDHATDRLLSAAQRAVGDKRRDYVRLAAALDAMGKRIILCPNPYRDTELQITKKIEQLLNGAGYETAVCPIFDTEKNSVVPDDVRKTRLMSVIGEASLVVVIGGDGTILHVARVAAAYEVPVIGVNAGTKGFMAALEQSDIGELLKAAGGQYTQKRRMGGAVWLDPDKTSPFDFYQYWRNVDDADVINCLRKMTFLPLEQIDEMSTWKDARLNEAKDILAWELTSLVHGAAPG